MAGRIKVDRVTKIELLPFRDGKLTGTQIQPDGDASEKLHRIMRDRSAAGQDVFPVGGPLYASDGSYPPMGEETTRLYIEDDVLLADVDLETQYETDGWAYAEPIAPDDVKVLVALHNWPNVRAEDVRADVYVRASKVHITAAS